MNACVRACVPSCLHEVGWLFFQGTNLLAVARCRRRHGAHKRSRITGSDVIYTLDAVQDHLYGRVSGERQLVHARLPDGGVRRGMY